MFVRDSCSKQLDSDRLAADVPGEGVRAALRSQAQASSRPFAGGTAMAGRAAKGEAHKSPKVLNRERKQKTRVRTRVSGDR
jgi:hypothetical protein